MQNFPTINNAFAGSSMSHVPDNKASFSSQSRAHGQDFQETLEKNRANFSYQGSIDNHGKKDGVAQEYPGQDSKVSLTQEDHKVEQKNDMTLREAMANDGKNCVKDNPFTRYAEWRKSLSDEDKAAKTTVEALKEELSKGEKGLGKARGVSTNEGENHRKESIKSESTNVENAEREGSLESSRANGNKGDSTLRKAITGYARFAQLDSLVSGYPGFSKSS